MSRACLYLVRDHKISLLQLCISNGQDRGDMPSLTIVHQRLTNQIFGVLRRLTWKTTRKHHRDQQLHHPVCNRSDAKSSHVWFEMPRSFVVGTKDTYCLLRPSDRITPRNPKEVGGIPDHRSDGAYIMGIMRGDETHEHGTDFILHGICWLRRLSVSNQRG